MPVSLSCDLDLIPEREITDRKRTAFPFCGFLADGYGRRICIFIGCLLVLVGTAIQTTAHETGQFIGGRFILGFGGKHADLRLARSHSLIPSIQPVLQAPLDLLTLSNWPTHATVVPWLECTTTVGCCVAKTIARTILTRA